MSDSKSISLAVMIRAGIEFFNNSNHKVIFCNSRDDLAKGAVRDVDVFCIDKSIKNITDQFVAWHKTFRYSLRKKIINEYSTQLFFEDSEGDSVICQWDIMASPSWRGCRYISFEELIKLSFKDKNVYWLADNGKIFYKVFREVLWGKRSKLSEREYLVIKDIEIESHSGLVGKLLQSISLKDFECNVLFLRRCLLNSRRIKDVFRRGRYSWLLFVRVWINPPGAFFKDRDGAESYQSRILNTVDRPFFSTVTLDLAHPILSRGRLRVYLCLRKLGHDGAAVFLTDGAVNRLHKLFGPLTPLIFLPKGISDD